MKKTWVIGAAVSSFCAFGVAMVLFVTGKGEPVAFPLLVMWTILVTWKFILDLAGVIRDRNREIMRLKDRNEK